jgi:peptidyl-prolyl cis-trans isomerase D
MGMMARMRSLAPWFILSVGGLFVLFMVLSDSKLSNLVNTRTNNVGSINGKDISYQEYSNLVEQYRKDQAQRSGQEIPESQMEAFRDQVWENLVYLFLIRKLLMSFKAQILLKLLHNTLLILQENLTDKHMIRQFMIRRTKKI